MKKKPNYIILGGVAVTMVVLILSSVISPIVIYLTLIFIGAISMLNMYRYEVHATETSKETAEPKEEVVEAEPDTPLELYKEEIEKARKFKDEGCTTEEIRNALKEKYEDTVVDYIIKQMEV